MKLRMASWISAGSSAKGLAGAGASDGVEFVEAEVVVEGVQLTNSLWDSYETFMETIRLFYSLSDVMCILAGA